MQVFVLPPALPAVVILSAVNEHVADSKSPFEDQTFYSIQQCSLASYISLQPWISFNVTHD